MKPKRRINKNSKEARKAREPSKENLLELQWNPKTEIGRKVKNKEITDINDILSKGKPILEQEIVEFLIPELESDLLMIGQSKGKFGGGQRRVFRQTQKKTKEGNKPNFATLAVVGNKDGLVGLGYGKAKETVPAREKAVRQAKIKIFKIRRGCGSWQCGCGTSHSIPFKVEGKTGSCVMRLYPAPNGTGLRVDKEIAKILTLAGITDVWSKTTGLTKTKLNLIKATEVALKNLVKTKIMPEHREKLSIVEGSHKKSDK
ncbi:30S ribosomal protein S5 [Candidatus Woesearchaeota archaeon]|nr:30S ribosomal protein S5 [Candidatus Woesearchaeota archaeon]